MARRPDGVGTSDPNFKETPDEGPAAERPATSAQALAGAIHKGERFPSGLKALEGKPDDERVKLVNLTMKNARYMKTVGPQASGKKGVVTETVEPFQTIECTVAEARVLLTHQEASAKRNPSPVFVVVGAFKGDCGGKRMFEAHGRKFRSCPFHECPQADHGDYSYSVWQSQHFLRTLKNVEAIDRFTTSFDLRADVVTLASFERRARDAARRAEQANAVGGNPVSEAVY